MCIRKTEFVGTARKEDNAECAVDAIYHANTDGDSTFVSNLYQLLYAQRTDARIVDSFLSDRMIDARIADPQKLPTGPTLSTTLNRLQTNSSVNIKCNHVRAYVSKLVVASTELKEDKQALRHMQPMLQWVISVFLPSVGDRVYRGTGSESAAVTRDIIIEILSHLGSPSSSRAAVVSQPNTATQVVATADQAVDSLERVSHEARGCERCYICFFMPAPPNRLLVCSHISPDEPGVPCIVGYCKSCVPHNKEVAFLCAIHQTRPTQPSKMFARQRCWDCPPGTEIRLLRHCIHCGKEMCYMCGLFDEAKLKDSSFKYICPSCRGDPKSLEAELQTRLTGLLRKAVNASIDPHQFSLSLVKTERIDSKALENLVNAAYDVFQAGFHEVARPFIKIVIDIDVRSAASALAKSPLKVVTHPSQYMRMFSGSHESRLVQKILSKALAIELVANHRSQPSDVEQSPCWAEYCAADWQAAPDGLPKAMIWMHDCSYSSPTASLVSHQLTELSKRGMFSSMVLCGRQVSKNEPYHAEDGAVAKLIRHFESKGNLMLFEPGATDAEISAFFHDAKADIVVDCTGYSFGGIPHILAGLGTAVKISYIGYPGPHFGIFDFTATTKNLLNQEYMQSRERERFIFMDSMYPPVGYHNGHHDTRKDWEDKLVVPEDHRPLLVFLGDGSKIREEGFHVWLDILAGTGDGPDSAVLMLLHSPETVMQQVERWRQNYNHGREGSEVIKPGRIRWIPYRSKQELWGWCSKVRGRALSISCPGAPYDVHTLCNDALWAALVHLGLRTPGQDWPTLVAPSLLEGAGLGETFIANSLEDFKAKGIMLALVSSQPYLLAASDHLMRCRDEGICHFNIEQPVLNLGRGLIRAWLEFRRTRGERDKMGDIDLTKLYPVRETRTFSAQAAAADSISESGAGQALRVLNQLDKINSKGLALCRYPLEMCVLHHHGLGFRKMTLEGLGSTTICLHAWNERGDSREYAIKATHFFNGKAQQEDRLATDANVKAVFCYIMARSRRSLFAKLMLPQIHGMYRHSGRPCLIAVVQGSVRTLPVQSKNSGNSEAKTQGIAWRKAKTPARSRPVITSTVCEYVPGGTLSTHDEVQRLVREYTNEGNISDGLIRVMQAVLHSVHFMNNKRIANFDISTSNIALRKFRDRWIVVWIDTGSSVVFDERFRPPLSERTVTSARTEEQDERFHGTLPAGPANSLPTPSIPKYVNGMSFITGDKVDEIFRDSRSRQQLTCWGTAEQRDDEFFASLKANYLKAKKELPANQADALIAQENELTMEDGVRCDACSGSLISLQLLRPAPKDKSDREQWKIELSLARDSSDNMVAFLSAGLNDGVSLKRPDVLSALGNVLYNLLRKDWRDRIPVHEALRRLVFTTDTLSLEEQRTMDSEGFVFPEGDCPEGSPWHQKGKRLPRVVVVTEPGLGAGVRADEDLLNDQLVCLYAGTEATNFTEIAVDDLPPSRRVTYARDKSNQKLHVVADQPFRVLRQKNTAGPLVNAALTDQEANVYIIRHEFWRDGEGNIYMPLYAKGFIAKGSFLRWKYDPFAGAGGKDSFNFGRE